MSYRQRPKVQYVRAARSEPAPFSDDGAYHSPRYSGAPPGAGLGFPEDDDYGYSLDSGSYEDLEEEDLDDDDPEEDAGENETATDESPVSPEPQKRHHLHPRAPSVPESRHSSQSQYYVVNTRHRPQRPQTYYNESEYVVVPRARMRSGDAPDDEFYEIRYSHHRDRSRRYYAHRRRRRPRLIEEEEKEPKEPPIIDELTKKLTAISEQLEKLREDEAAREILFEKDWNISLKESEKK